MQAHTKSKIAYYISMFIIATAIMFVSIASYFAFKSVQVIHPNVQPYHVITKELKAGDTFIYEVDACKYRALSSVVTRRFVDENGTRYPQPPEASNIVEGCGKIRVPVGTPSTLHGGVWYMDLEVAYKVNPLRTENYHFTTDTFLIK